MSAAELRQMLRAEIESYLPAGALDASKADHPREVVEAALAHVVGNQTEAAHARSDLFERRRNLMNAWAAYCAPTA